MISVKMVTSFLENCVKTAYVCVCVWVFLLIIIVCLYLYTMRIVVRL